MEAIFSAVSDIIVIFFDLLIYTRLTTLKQDTKAYRWVMYSCCLVILVAYFIATYIMHFPVAISSFLIMSLPSFLAFWLLSRYKDARFFVTFCFVDTVTLIIAFLSRALAIIGGTPGALAGCVFTLVLFSTIYVVGRPYFPRYRELLERVPDGWGSMMVATLLIYILMIFTPAYPKPMIQRTEYLPQYFLLSATVIAFYVVFIITLLQKRRLHELNIRLSNERKWHDMAYVDGLTQLPNRMAYIERINALSRSEDNSTIHAVIVDIDGFKAINDTFGHHTGDRKLQQAAALFAKIFAEPSYQVFRIGGDEFAIIAINVSPEALEEKLLQLNDPYDEVDCVFSYGHSAVRENENNAMENAFIRADAAMYQQKKSKKMNN